MTKELIKITEDDFYEKFKPVKNHLDDNASWNGWMYETFDEERDYCFELSKKENRVWTIIDCGDDEDFIPSECEDEDYIPSKLVIISGYHYINRLGFIVTEIPYEDETEVDIEN